LVCGVALALVALLGASVASPAVGGPKVLTLSKAKKVFVTKKKANKTYVTQKQAAAFLTTASADSRYLTPGGADAGYLPRTGETRVPVEPSNWDLADSTDDVIISHATVSTALAKSAVAANDVDFFAPVAVPTMVGGLGLKVAGIELCYLIPAGGLDSPVLDRIVLQRGARSPSVPVPTTLSTLAVDDTGRVDSACTTVRFTPVALLPTDIVGVGIRVDYADANTLVRVGAGSLILVS
jgi:hypothetical protein